MLHFNEPYSYYGLGVSLVLLPFVGLGHVTSGNSAALLSLFEPLVTAATVATLWLLLRELGASRRRSLWIAWLFAFGTLAWHYAGVLFSEPLVALCLTTTVLGLLRFRRSGQSSSLLVAGSAVGIALMARVDSAPLIFLPVSLYLLALIIRRERRLVAPSGRPRAWLRIGKPMTVFCAPVMLGGAVDIWYDWVRYGRPLQTGYAADGLGFTYPWIKGIYGLLLSPGVGLFVFVPVLAMALFGLPDFRKRWPLESALLAAIIGLRVVFYAGWYGWDGGVSWGPRYLVPILPLAMVGLAFLSVTGWRRVGLWATGGLSIGIQVLGQLVWFISWFGPTATALAPRLDLPRCGACGPSSVLAVQRLKELIDFDWHYSPLVGQLRLLLEGGAHPAWAPVAWLVPVLLVGIAACGWYQWRLAAPKGPRAIRIPEAA
jgi:hypothetical protein